MKLECDRCGKLTDEKDAVMTVARPGLMARLLADRHLDTTAYFYCMPCYKKNKKEQEKYRKELMAKRGKK